MKSYVSIAHKIDRGVYVHAFDKIDGTLIKTEWTRKRGMKKFGTKAGLIDETSDFGEAIGLIDAGFAKELDGIFRKERHDKVTAFFEFWGPNSFAGTHADEPHKTTLFDVAPFKRGIIGPAEFLKLFGHLDVPEVLYRGRAGAEFEEMVRSGELEGMTFEGVVCKGKPKGKMLMPTMFKIKNRAWIERLKAFCGGNEKRFKELL